MSWICPKCETENPDRLRVCEVCDSLHNIRDVNDLQDEERAWYKKAVLYENEVTKRVYLTSKYDGYTYKEIFKYAPNLLLTADKGNPDAQYMLGDLFISHKKNAYKASAFIWFARAANQGNGNAMAKLAFCYEKGLGTEINNTLAMKWYENAINKDCKLKGEALQGLSRIQEKYRDKHLHDSAKSIHNISFSARYYIQGRSGSYNGWELFLMDLPKGTLIRKMLTEEWFPIGAK